MNKGIRILLALILSTSMMASTVLANNINDMKDKSNNIKQDINKEKQEIKDLENNKMNILNEVNELDKSINSLDMEIEQISKKINETNNKIQGLERKADELKADLAKNEDLMAKRLRIMYMNQSQSYVEILFSSEGLYDFIERIEIVSSLIKYDKNLIKEFKEKQSALEVTTTEVKSEKTSLESMKSESDVKLNALKEKKQQKDTMIAQLEQDINTHEQLVAQQEKEFNEILASITQMEKELAEQNKPSRGDGNSSNSMVTDGNIFSITGGVKRTITQRFEGRISPITGKPEFHGALDIGAPHGSSVHALKSGVVSYAGWMNGYGNVVVISHGNIKSLYAHNSQLLVSRGQTVEGGQQIAKVGSTGWSTGPHIHFEVINSNGEKIDPEPYYIY